MSSYLSPQFKYMIVHILICILIKTFYEGTKLRLFKFGGGLMPVNGEFSVNLSVNNGMSNYL